MLREVRDRLLSFGAQPLSEAELFELLGAPADLLTTVGGLRAVMTMNPGDIVLRFGRVAGLRLLAALELGRRALVTPDERPKLATPQEVAAFLMPRLSVLPREEFHVICVNARNTVLRAECVFTGTADSCPVDPREVFAVALASKCAGFVVAHNHPAGDPTPSTLDISLTRQLARGAELLGLKLLDHVVIGHGTFVSMQERGSSGCRRSSTHQHRPEGGFRGKTGCRIRAFPGKVPMTTKPDPRPQFEALRAELNAAFAERKEIVTGALAALLSRQNMLIVGPPGSAKSQIIRRISSALQAPYFETLVTRHSVPEDVFGALSLSALERDKYVRNTAGRLPTASIGFIDEIWKCNGALLHGLLGIALDRVFFNDGPQPCPLISLFAASNELPEPGSDLEPVLDRFVLRYAVSWLRSEHNFKRILASTTVPQSVVLGLPLLEQAQREVSAMPVSDAAIDAMVTIRESLSLDGVRCSDRRWVQMVSVAKAFAYLDRENEVVPESLAGLVDCIWRDPAKERPVVARVVGKIADPVSTLATEVLDAAREVSAKVASLRSGDRKAYVGQCADAMQQFEQQRAKLAELAKGAGQKPPSTTPRWRSSSCTLR